MITVISPEYFKTIPWKNGLGSTTELAISPNSTLADFDWRLSIATVANDGVFSDFSGYERNLILIEGNGLTLKHDSGQVDELSQLLDIANFDGGWQTDGLLTNGTIKDFNIMAKQGYYQTNVCTYIAKQVVTLDPKLSSLCFAYSLSGEIQIVQGDHKLFAPKGFLCRIDNQESASDKDINLIGEHMIVIELTQQEAKR